MTTATEILMKLKIWLYAG